MLRKVGHPVLSWPDEKGVQSSVRHCILAEGCHHSMANQSLQRLLVWLLRTVSLEGCQTCRPAAQLVQHLDMVSEVFHAFMEPAYPHSSSVLNCESSKRLADLLFYPRTAESILPPVASVDIGTSLLEVERRLADSLTLSNFLFSHVC